MCDTVLCYVYRQFNAMDIKIMVEHVELTEENCRSFRQFTSKIVGAGLKVPDNNELFFCYRQSHNGMCVPPFDVL